MGDRKIMMKEACERIAHIIGADAKQVCNVGLALRKANMIPTAGRGNSGAKISRHHVTTILTGTLLNMCGVPAERCASAIGLYHGEVLAAVSGRTTFRACMIATGPLRIVVEINDTASRALADLCDEAANA